MAGALTLYSDAPIASARFDTFGRGPVATRVLDLVMYEFERPLVVGLVGAAGTGKTSLLHMVGELCAARVDLRAFAIDAWVAGDAGKLNEEFVREVSQIFEEEHVVGQGEKARDKLLAVGDVVSAVARFAGAKVDVKGALEKTPDKLRDEVLVYSEKIGKRIVVLIDHLDRLPPAEAVTALKLIARWGTFPYFAFVVAVDRAVVGRKLHGVDGNRDDLDRVLAVELVVPPVDRVALAGAVRGGLADLSRSIGADGAGALALFDVEAGMGFHVVTTPRHAKRFLNALTASLPLLPPAIDLRTACLVELIREADPDAYDALAARYPFSEDRGLLASELAVGRSPTIAKLLAAL